MKLIDALALNSRPFPSDAPLFSIFLACGFTPLHLQTFLTASLRQRSPLERAEVTTGLFGDLAGNIERLQPSTCDALVIVTEWQDLDLRLGIRNLGGWRVPDVADIVASAERTAVRLEKTIRHAAGSVPVYLSLPTLPLPPLFHTPNQLTSPYEFRLRSAVDTFAAALSTHARIFILNAQQLDESSPPASRFDVQSEIVSGFPYQLSHASALADQLAALLRSPTPKKGLITDLDDTLWAGILGENGVNGVSWHLDQQAHIHGLYQQFLASLASAGILAAVASKNDAELVDSAFAREDLLLSRDSLYPMDVHWGPKSESVRRILKTWNIAPDSVVFIDDSPMELAEVQAAFPEIECLLFPKRDYQTFWKLLKHLREVFGKSFISDEDSIRLDSIRSAAALPGPNGDSTSLDTFLQDAQASVVFSFGKDSDDRRAFALINKTNQFNLNGKRLTESAWSAYLADPKAFLMTVTYQDKYGALGKIAVLLGRIDENVATIDYWVMSCRAFSRRIEQQSLAWLFENFRLREIHFDYRETERNSPLADFLAGITAAPLDAHVRLSRETFFEKCPPLFLQAKAMVNG